MKRFISLALVLVFISASVPAFAGTENDGAVVGDALMARPLGIAAVAGGAALWVITAPFALLGGNLSKTTETLITNPVKYTFARPVGDFDYDPSPAETDEKKP